MSFGIHSRQQKDPPQRTSCSQNHLNQSKHPSWQQHSAHSKLNGQDVLHIEPNYKLFSGWAENVKGQLRHHQLVTINFQTKFLWRIQVSCKAIKPSVSFCLIQISFMACLRIVKCILRNTCFDILLSNAVTFRHI